MEKKWFLSFLGNEGKEQVLQNFSSFVNFLVSLIGNQRLLEFMYGFSLIFMYKCNAVMLMLQIVIAAWFVLQLQYRGLQENQSAHLPWSPFAIGNGNRYRICYQLKFDNYAKAGKDSHILRSPLGSRRAFHLRLGCLNDMAPANTVIYGSLSSGIRRSSATRRFFSQDLSLTNRRENVGLRGKEGVGRALGFQAFNKAKTLAAHSKNRAANSDFSASKDVDTVMTREQLAGDGKEDVMLGSSISTSPVKNDNQNSKIHRQQKQQSGSKKSKIRQSAGSASEEAVVAKGPESSSQAKRSISSKKGKEFSQASEVSNY